jgi:hypothetical protein
MPVDASIYSAFIRPVRSVAEYEREAADVEGARSRNALQALSLRQGQRSEEDAARLRTEQEGARNALAGLGGSAAPDARISALRALGTQTGFAQADALEKGHLERQKTDAEIGSKRATTATSEFDLRKKRLDFTIGGMANAGDVEGIKQHLVAGVQRGDIDMKTAEQMMRAVPADPAAFGDWRRDTLMRALDAKEQMRFTTPDAGQVLTAQTSVANNAATNARAAAEAAAGRAVTTRGQNMVDARTRELTGATRQAAADTKREATDEKAVNKFSATLQKEGIPELETAVSGAEGALGRYAPGKVPGIGAVKNALPAALMSDEGKDVRQALAQVRNIVLSARSGAAVTDQELRRLVEEIGTGAGMSEADIRKGLAKVRARVDKIKENAAAGVNDDVLRTYQDRGGIAIKRGGARGAAAPATGGFKYLGTE